MPPGEALGELLQDGQGTPQQLALLMGELIEHGKTSDIFLNPQKKQTEMYIQGKYG